MKLNEKLIEKVDDLFDENYIKHMKAYLHTNIATMEGDIDYIVDPNDLKYRYHQLYEYYLTLAYFDADCRDTIINEILPELKDKEDFFNDVLHTKNCLDYEYKTCKKPLNENINKDFSFKNDIKVDWNNMISNNAFKKATKGMFDNVSTTTDHLNNDFEYDYTQPSVRKVCDENKLKDFDKDYQDFKNYMDNYSKENNIAFKFNTESSKKNLENYNFVNHPNHYNSYDIEVIEMMRRIWGDERVADFCEINAFKYRMRMGTKPGEDVSRDVQKEQWYLKKAKELRTK